MSKKVLFIFLITSVISGIVVAVKNFKKPEYNNLASINIISPAKNLDNFELIDTQGKKFNHQNLKGHWNLLFFGYSDCPDICPSTLTILRQVWLNLNDQIRQSTNFYFVSINPDIDNYLKLKKYLNHFHSDFRGLTGTPIQIAHLTKKLGIVSWADQDSSKINHSSVLLVINPKGQLSGLFSPPFDIKSIINDLNIII